MCTCNIFFLTVYTVYHKIKDMFIQDWSYVHGDRHPHQTSPWEEDRLKKNPFKYIIIH